MVRGVFEMAKTRLVFLALLLPMLLAAGCVQSPAVEQGNNSASPQPTVQPSPSAFPSPTPSETPLEAAYRELGCSSAEECEAYCQTNHEACDKFCGEHTEVCGQMLPESGKEPTQCDSPVLIAKMKALVDSALVSPPETIRSPNWMTKILPSGNPYPGYYYDISTAFGPAIDAAMASGTKWSGEGAPPVADGQYHYSFGYWDEVPKGKGATLGQETPEAIDFSRYQLAVFYTTKSGSQDEMINSISSISMTESEAREYFYSIFKKSFINLDQRSLAKKGDKFYEAKWSDSARTNDYWDVQIGEGYIAIGQGKVYSDESALAGNVGTIWLYHGCRPCTDCAEWGEGGELNRDCTVDADCLSGLACSSGYCVKAAPSAATPSPQAGAGGPGSHCSTAGDCGSGLLCVNSVCSTPAGDGP